MFPTEAGGNTFMLMYMLYNPLVKVATDMTTLEPDLAGSWEAAPDASSFTFHLRNDVKWQDGTPFTAKDVVFTATWSAQNLDYFLEFPPAWKDVKGASAIKGTDNPLVGVEQIDDYTVKFTLETPNAEWLHGLADAENVIFPEHLVKGISGKNIDTSDFATKAPVGTGPYKFVSMNKDTGVEFAANPDYFKGAPKIARAFFRVVAADTAVAQLQSGDIDLVLDVPSAEYDRLKTDPNLNVLSVPEAGVVRLDLAVDHPPFDNQKVRQAAYYAINRAGIVQDVLHGRGKLLFNPPGFKEYSDLQHYDYNPDKAKQLLAEAGFDGAAHPVRLAYELNTPNADVYMPIVQQDLQAVGFKVELHPMDQAAVSAMVADPKRYSNYEAWQGQGGLEGMSPDRTAVYYNCKDLAITTDTTAYQNCHMDDLFVQARSVTDPAARDAIYHQIALILNTDLPSLYWWTGQNVHVATTKLGGGFAVPGFERYAVMNIQDWTLQP